MEQQYDLDGTDLSPLLTDSSAELKTAAFTQYPRCGSTKRPNGCQQVSHRNIGIMGFECMRRMNSSTPGTHLRLRRYAIRTARWRYVAWMPFDARKGARWRKAPLYVELYDHRNDDGTDLEMPFEAINLAGTRKDCERMEEVMMPLHRQLALEFARVRGDQTSGSL